MADKKKKGEESEANAEVVGKASAAEGSEAAPAAEGKKSKEGKGEKGGKGKEGKEPKEKKAKKEEGAKPPDGGTDKPAEPAPPPRLALMYKSTVIPKLRDQFKYKNAMAVPRIVKVVLNSGVKQGDDREKRLQTVARDLGLIAGQKPLITTARRSVSGFRLRQGERIGAKVTLRKARMFEFLDRLISIAMPRVRDFRGLDPKSFDGRGNYTFGIDEQIIFPEVDIDSVENYFGLDVTIVTTARSDDEARELLRGFGFPFAATNVAATN